MTDARSEELCSPERARQRARALGLADDLVAQAAAAAVQTPSRQHWRQLLAAATGTLGAGLFASGAVTFVAYNWAALGRLARLSLVQVVLIAAVILSVRALPRLAGQLALTVAAVLVGAVLAVFGQTYQTGADPFELFVAWAVLIVPWTLAARFEPLYLLHSIVVATGAVLAWHQLADRDDGGFFPAALSLWALWVLAIAAWELQARGRPVQAHRWLPRVWAALAGLALAAAASYSLVDGTDPARTGLALGAVAASIALVAWRYHRRSIDLFMQTVACGLLATVISTGLGRVIFQGGSIEALLLLGLAVTGQAALAVAWLRREARRAGGG